jgi:hypothetical protein
MPPSAGFGLSASELVSRADGVSDAKAKRNHQTRCGN